MKALFIQLTARFDALSRRERYLVALALLGGIALVVWSALIDPAQARRLAAERGIGEQRAQLATLLAQTQALQAPGQTPEALARAELGELNRQLASLDARYRALDASLVAPQQVSALLKDLLGGQNGLRLLSLRTLPVAPVLVAKGGTATPAAPSAKASPAAGLYQHGVEIRLEGGYADLAAYLERLEKSPQKLLWNSVTLSAEGTPRLVLTLTVFTLSLDKTWLIV